MDGWPDLWMAPGFRLVPFLPSVPDYSPPAAARYRRGSS
jgi:hypothetical protein